MEILRIENLSFRYPEAAQKALDDISLDVSAGEFLVVCGESGCGKTTLLKMLKSALTPHGEKSGRFFYRGTPLEALPPRTSASEIGYVFQDPDAQIVTDKVWHELAFGLENLGLDTAIIRRRVAEMANFFGITDWFLSDTDALSGGQKQLLNLASVMIMQPRVLLLDEPTAQLDPIAAADFIATLLKLNRELGLTVLLVEQRLEEVFPIADRVVLMERGKVLLCDTPPKTARLLRELKESHPMLCALPSAARIFTALKAHGDCPLTVRDGRRFLAENYSKNHVAFIPPQRVLSDEYALEMKDVWFRYGRDTRDVLKGLELRARKGEILCVLGGNGTGKTTALGVSAGLLKAYRGSVRIFGKKLKEYKGNELYRHTLALLPQNPQTVFTADTVGEDLKAILAASGCPATECTEKIRSIAERLSVSDYLGKHPFDLSGGEQQRCALAKALLTEPRLLLLDEPTKGIDAHLKNRLREILFNIKKQGVTVIIVTHDVEFAAETADECALFFDGNTICTDTPERFFSDNSFYTTAANRLSRDIFNSAVTCEAVIELCRQSTARLADD